MSASPEPREERETAAWGAAAAQADLRVEAEIPPADQHVRSDRPVGPALLETPYLRVVGAVLWKDLSAELRSRELVSSMLIFSVLVILIFNFALELEVQTRTAITSGVLWVTLVFAGTIGLNRSMAVEKDRGCLDGLLLAPVDRTAIYFGKALGNWIFMLLVALIVVPLFSILYNSNLINPGLLLVILLGTAGYAAVGTLLSAMAVEARTRDILLPILLFPVVVPALIASVKASSGFLDVLAMADIQPWLSLLIAYDVIFIAAAFMVFDYVVEE
ncbi:MAG TPA: heme exporter protein CcmB [Anaerolineaceae bacterium]